MTHPVHELLKEHQGRGILSLSDGVLVPVTFRFPPGPETDNRIHVAIESDVKAIMDVGREASRDPLRPCRLAGTTDTGAEFACERVFVDKLTARWPGVNCDAELFPSSDIVISYPRGAAATSGALEHVFLVCNLLFRGDETVTRKDTMDPGATTIKVAGNRLHLTMLQEYDETKAALGRHPKGLVTVEARVATERAIEDVFTDTILPFSMLATLADHCFVVPVCSATRDGSGWRVVRHQPVKTYPFVSVDPAIEIARTNRRALKEYVEACYDLYMRWKDALRLDVLIEYAANGSLGQTRETKYLMFCVGLECLADSGERVLREAGIELPLTGYQRNLELLTTFLRERNVAVGEGDIQKLARSVSYNRPGMKATLEALFKHFNVSYRASDLNFIDVRNTLVHTGLFPSAGAGSRDLTQELEDFYDRVLLTILRYPGRDHVVRTKRFRTEAL